MKNLITEQMLNVLEHLKYDSENNIIIADCDIMCETDKEAGKSELKDLPANNDKETNA